MVRKFFLLFLLLNNCVIFGSDSKDSDSDSSGTSVSKKPTLGMLISYDEMSTCVHKYFEGRPGSNVEAIIEDISGQSIVPLSDLFRKSYRDASTKKRHSYWYNSDTEESYGVEDPAVLENRIGFDADIIRRELAGYNTERAVRSHGHKYKGKSRNILSSCPVEHAFHLGCIKNALDNCGSRCPLCLTPATRESIKFNPSYKMGETCAICHDTIAPSPVVAPVGSHFRSAAVVSAGSGMAGSGTGAGGATTTPATSSVRFGSGVKTVDHFGGGRGAGSNVFKKHRGGGAGFGHDRDDSESLS